MKTTLLVIQMIVSLLLTLLILLQVKGIGFGRVWGGLSTASTKRGLEVFVFKLTFIVSALFLLSAAVMLFF